MNRLISLAVAIALFVSFSAEAVSTKEAVFTERKGRGAEEFLWNEISEHSPSDEITAAVLSYFWRESQFRSDSVAGWAMSYAGYGVDLCAKVTEKTDDGLEDGSSRDYFLWACDHYGGYGLGQWRSSAYIGHLYDYAVEYGTSIGDARMQCGFVIESLKENEELWKKLKKCRDAERAGRLVAIYYDGTQSGADYIGYKAKRFFNKYHEGE